MKLGFENFKSLMVGKPVAIQDRKYLCWRCEKEYSDPKDYLWHIQYC
ncbi:MAG: hypothetical protein KGH65_04190 [Candidatus Micrarchaeota archaeon]|nr:hypothetical protein [Candidatus Micrarchaeota archaeon]